MNEIVIESIEYSSSFAEMGLAINETIRNSEIDSLNFDDLSLTPAHQILISCIWMSLKVKILIFIVKFYLFQQNNA